ncbi:MULTISPECIES: TetR/AcrR family transcriptional regulator [Shewanella]|uniref:TetR/AcrR family transcriptional regulator n=1 Tax=Shewanella indica TaxID=768528 RepID=A0ABU4QDU8_9GAMM|nr:MULTISPECIES: TetR/AcrR family transcriptional regulator [Shewanella]MDX6016700.1 TetR/AcrR family transcriptional regulator [Shewanella indica]NDO73535.1 TetR/AcrR family transcriptional regulator [Shewanella sp. SE1]
MKRSSEAARAISSKQDKKQQILGSALQLFVEQGFYATSTASIARHAGVATGTLFHHFSSKETLMDQLFLAIKTEFANAISASLPKTPASITELPQRAEMLWQAGLDWALAQPLKLSFFVQYAMSPSVSEAVRQQAMHGILGFIAELLEQGINQGVLADLPRELLLEACHSQFLAAARCFCNQPQKATREARDASFRLFWRGVAA